MNLYTEIEKIFSEIEKACSQEYLLDFKNAPLIELHLYHFGLGTWIRNNYLWHEKSVLHELFLENGIKHPDYMSYFIIGCFTIIYRRKYKNTS